MKVFHPIATHRAQSFVTTCSRNFMQVEPESLQNLFDRTFAAVDQRVCGVLSLKLSPREFGEITDVPTGIAWVWGDLKQPQVAPVSVPGQIAVLLALTAGLFDPVPIEQMAGAEQAVREAAENMPAEVCARFEAAADLNAEDRNTIIEIARIALSPFQLSRQSKTKVGAEPKPSAQSQTKEKPTSPLKERS